LRDNRARVFGRYKVEATHDLLKKKQMTLGLGLQTMTADGCHLAFQERKGSTIIAQISNSRERPLLVVSGLIRKFTEKHPNERD
jgi:hypothetical protein